MNGYDAVNDILMFTLTECHDHDDVLTRAHLTAGRYYGTQPYDLVRLHAHDAKAPFGPDRDSDGFQVLVEVKAR